MKNITTVLAALACSTMPAFCWDYTGNYDNVPPKHLLDVQIPAIIKTVKIGGFALQVDRQEMGYRIYPSTGPLLGEFSGDRFDLQVKRLPSGRSLQDLAFGMKSDGDHISLTPVKSHGLSGLRAEYGGKPNAFSDDVHAVRYFFVNSAGDTICFDATATAPHVDWSEVKHLVGDTIQLDRA